MTTALKFRLEPTVFYMKDGRYIVGSHLIETNWNSADLINWGLSEHDLVIAPLEVFCRSQYVPI